jgi:hypothetical protein
VYGEFVGAHHLEAAILSTLWKWLPSYQYEVSREAGLEPQHLQPIRSWRVATDMERYPEDQLPGVILVNQGVPEPPRKYNSDDGASMFMAYWVVQIGIHAVAKGQKVNAAPRALTLARMYSLAIRLVMIQQRDDDGVMGMVDPLTEAPSSTLSVEDDRTTCLCVGSFSVQSTDWAEWGEGPLEPEVDPVDENRPEWPVVVGWDLDVDKVPVDADVQHYQED